VKVFAIKGRSGLGEGRIQQTEVADARSATALLDEHLVKPNDLTKRHVAHQAKRR